MESLKNDFDESDFEEEESEAEDSPNWHRTPLFQRIKKVHFENKHQLVAEAKKKDTTMAMKGEEEVTNVFY